MLLARRNTSKSNHQENFQSSLTHRISETSGKLKVDCARSRDVGNRQTIENETRKSGKCNEKRNYTII